MNQRISYLDILKGIGIVYMIMGHTWFGENFDYYIHAFNMPLFFIASGFLYTEKKQITLKEYCKKKAKSLLIPYIIFAIFHYIIYVMININNQVDFCAPIKSILWSNFYGKMPISGALWFLTALFFTEVIHEILIKYIKNKKIFCAMVLILFILGTIMEQRLPWGIDIAFVGLGLFVVGRLLGTYKDKIINKNNNFFIIITVLVLNGAMIFLNGYVNMRISEYSNILLFIINAVVATIGYMKLSCFLEKFKFAKVFEFIGENSIIYLCLNQILIFILAKLLVYFKVNENITVYTTVIFLGTIIILSGITTVVNHTKLKKLFGK